MTCIYIVHELHSEVPRIYCLVFHLQLGKSLVVILSLFLIVLTIAFTTAFYSGHYYHPPARPHHHFHPFVITTFTLLIAEFGAVDCL